MELEQRAVRRHMHLLHQAPQAVRVELDEAAGVRRVRRQVARGQVAVPCTNNNDDKSAGRIRTRISGWGREEKRGAPLWIAYGGVLRSTPG
jgi:hypothetical protein